MTGVEQTPSNQPGSDTELTIDGQIQPSTIAIGGEHSEQLILMLGGDSHAHDVDGQTG